MLKLLLNGMGVYISIMHSFGDRPLFDTISTTRMPTICQRVGSYAFLFFWLQSYYVVTQILICRPNVVSLFSLQKKVVVSFSTTSVEEIISVEERSLIISHKESLRVSSLSFLSEEKDEEAVPYLLVARCF